MKIKISKKDKIFAVVHNGLVASGIIRSLEKNNYKNIITISKKKLNLLDQKKTYYFLNKNC